MTKFTVIAAAVLTLGVSAAAGTGMLVTEIVGNKPSTIDLKAFSPERFS